MLVVRLDLVVTSGPKGVKVKSETICQNTEPIAYSDSVGTQQKRHCEQCVTVSRGFLLTNT